MAAQALPDVPNTDSNLLPVPIIPFQANIASHIKALGYDNRNGLEFDFGDCSAAWYILGLDQYAGPTPVPPRAQYEDYCQCLLARIAAITPITGAPNHKNQRRRFRIITAAIQTLSGHRRTHASTVHPTPWRRDDAFPGPRDLVLPAGTSWQAHMARTVTSPCHALPFHPAGARITARTDRTLRFRSTARRHIVARARQRRAYLATLLPPPQQQQQQQRPRGGGAPAQAEPTQRERFYNRRRIRDAEWEHANRHTAFAVQDDRGRVHSAAVVPCLRAFDNSLWHALSYQVNGAGAGRDNAFLGLRGGRREKAWLYNYFVDALLDGTHPRHRAYTWLQQSAKTTLEGEGEGEGEGGLMAAWGELSILRALAVNRPHAGRPKAPAFAGIFQLISDFFGREVVVFAGQQGLAAPAGTQLKSSWRLPYAYHVFGKAASGNGGQLFFVTDEAWTHFDAVTVVFDDASDPELLRRFDTSETGNEHRFGARFGFPFLAAGQALADIPASTSPGGTATYSRPADDPRYRLANSHALVRQARNDWDVVDARTGGLMPVLPSVATMQAQWDVEFDAADMGPAQFEPWLVASGGFRQRNGVAESSQWATGLYRDKVAKMFYDSRNALWARGAQVEVGERRQEPNEMHVVDGVPHIQFRQRRRGSRQARRVVRRGGEMRPRHLHFDDVAF